MSLHKARVIWTVSQTTKLHFKISVSILVLDNSNNDFRRSLQYLNVRFYL